MSTRAPLTHFLAIPLYTPVAANRINASLGRFAAEAKANTTVISSSSSWTATKSTASISSDGLALEVDTLCLNRQIISESEAASINAQQSSQANPSLPTPPPPLLPRDSLRPPSSLHLTLGVMSLSDPQQLERASAYLQSLDINVLLKSAAVTAAASIARANAKAEIKANAKARAKARKQNKTTSEGSLPSTPSSSSSSSPSPSPSATEDGDQDQSVDNQQHQEQEDALSPLVVSLRGLLPMQTPDATTVLYAPPYDITGRLQPFCEALQKLFVEAGFVQPEKRPLKLHASIVNTLHVKNKSSYGKSDGASSNGAWRGGLRRGGGGGGEGSQGGQRQGQRQGQGGMGRNNVRLMIDATELIQTWKDEVWAEVTLEKVVICEMGAKLSSDGLLRYREVAEIPMPTTV
ncbi:hypothetical protein BGX27_009658 [Mortierella sp. AM989]|nr:hypothetical protein BGX27_009658 [Mortierella sp. AM989]